MSAEVRPASFYSYCPECHEGDGPHADEDDAQEVADEHNAEYHNEPDRSDDAYDHFIESLRNP